MYLCIFPLFVFLTVLCSCEVKIKYGCQSCLHLYCVSKITDWDPRFYNALNLNRRRFSPFTENILTVHSFDILYEPFNWVLTFYSQPFSWTRHKNNNLMPVHKSVKKKCVIILLLLLSGNVESNPGPGPSCMSTPDDFVLSWNFLELMSEVFSLN